MTGYTKLFTSILGSTIWREDPATKVVWITLLALADQDGIAEASVPGLANYSGVNVETTEAALQKFLSPDPWSRTPENEGRRIEEVDGGWRLLNHGKYREKMSLDDLRERARIRQQRFRDRHSVTPERDASVTQRDGHNESRMSRHAEAEQNQRQGKRKQSPARLIATTEAERFALRVIRSLELIADNSLLGIIAQSIVVLSRVESLTAERAWEVLTERAKADPEFNSDL